ncbi:MAG TPA: M1 family aminopeptidase [Acidimicrobiales bacterium]|nr:M1 family aminopeptidase [Acidimicrobiales bacterium]
MVAGRPAVVALLMATLVACRDDGGGATGSGAMAPSSAPATTATTAAPTSLPAATRPSCPAVPPRAEPAPARPRYALRVDVRPAQGVVEGDVRVRFTPDLATDRLVFRLWPNAPVLAAEGARLEAGAVTVDGRPVDAVLEEPTVLVVRPGRPLGAGAAVDVALPWTLRLPAASGDRVSLDGDAVRLGSFFPILSWEPGVGWATEPPTGGFAEASTAPTADFDLTVTVPDGLSVLASGTNDRPGHWTATAMRDVAVSVGRFATATGVARAPDPVEVTVGVHRGVVGASAEAYRDRVVASLEDFGRRFGAYPWPTYTLGITPRLGGGIEYPGHVMQGPGTLMRTTSHEVAHQWFYGLVGNDQGRDPWLDEGLATWAEGRFEGTLDLLRSRPLPPAAAGHLAEPMTYWDARPGAYYAGAYVQGAQALAALGDPSLVDCALRVYVAQEAHQVARPRDLVAATAAVFPDAAATLARFGVRA